METLNGEHWKPVKKYWLCFKDHTLISLPPGMKRKMSQYGTIKLYMYMVQPAF